MIIIRLLSLFAGIGAFEKALRNKNIDYEIVNYSEIDQNISKSYSILNNIDTSLNLGDITKINDEKLPKNIDLMTWGFPCVSFSNANHNINRKGLDGEGSNLYFDGLHVLQIVKPKYSIIENVIDLVNDPKFSSHYQMILNDLDMAGYKSYTFKMNSCDYNLPQNRKRVFIISIRKDIPLVVSNPMPKKLELKAETLFDKNVEDKFMKINPKIIDKIKEKNLNNWDICPTITRAIGRAGSSKEYISNCAFVYHNTKTLRRMTPSETLKFMGFEQSDYEMLKANGISDTTIFNMAGNSIAVPVIESIYEILFR